MTCMRVSHSFLVSTNSMRKIMLYSRVGYKSMFLLAKIKGNLSGNFQKKVILPRFAAMHAAALIPMMQLTPRKVQCYLVIFITGYSSGYGQACALARFFGN